MQIGVVDAHSIHSFNQYLYPEQHPNNFSYLTQQFANTQALLTDMGRSIMEQAQKQFMHFYDENEIRKARAGLFLSSDHNGPDIIRPLFTLDQLRLAQPQMQRWIMAEPTLREKWQNNLATGYETYFDIDPKGIGENHYDHNLVYSGDFQITGEDTFLIREYPDLAMEGDVVLTGRQRNELKFTLDAVREQVLAGEDPSDIFCGQVG